MNENEQQSEISRLEADLRQNQNSANSALCLSEAYLLVGDYLRGWRLYTSRYSDPRFIANEYAEIFKTYFAHQTPWQGQSLHQKTILVLHEQGNGDLFMTIRYLKKLKDERRATVKIMVQDKSLINLFKHQPYISLATDLSGQNESMPEADFWCLGFDLPLIFQTELDTIPPNCLLPNQKLVEKWKQKLPSQNKLRVGLVWKGNPDYVYDKTRSLPALSILSPLFNISDVQFFSLQKGCGENEAAAAASAIPNFVHLAGELVDYSETAAIIQNLDLVISSDTGVAHLAGALSKPVWLMTPGLDTCWRWMLKRTDSPWYPSMRLFRQTRSDAERADWSRVVSEIAIELEKLSVKKRRRRLLNPLNWF